ncbi:MAG: GGDEF domain-containing protein [Rhizobacter sp.]|nr:GGDEF domain-containing protein [Rhizobacter sp.]
MSFSKFILKNLEPILLEWEAFAATLVPEEQRMDRELLRDHGKKMLETIARDLSQPESAQQKSDKSKGAGAGNDGHTAAKVHGADRLALGFTLNSAVAEYRALRASVIRLWQEEIKKTPTAKPAFEDLIRFNEAIDQAITESVTSYSAEKDQQSRVFNTILSNSPDLSFTFDPAAKLNFGNRAFLEFFNLSPQEVVGKRWTDLLAPAGAELHGHVKAVIKRREKLHAEIELKSQGGSVVVFDGIFVPVLTDDQKLEAVAGTMRDITGRIVVEKGNWKKANFDELTGLPNRSLFFDRLEQAVLHSARTGAVTPLLFIDLDRFKQANDSFGHEVGDMLLKFAADRIRACVREADTVARLGGDEFTVILRDVHDAVHIRTVAEKIVKALATPFQIHEHVVQVSASVGVGISPQDAQSTQLLMRNADLAMYSAKRAGRDQVVFFSADLLALPTTESTFGRL